MKELIKIPSNTDARGTAMCSRDLNFCYMTQDSFLRELSKTLYDNGIELCPMLYRINKNRNNGEAN